MKDVVASAGNGIMDLYNSFIGFFPSSVGSFINFLILVLLIVVYAVVVWHGYRFISKKNPLGLNLNQYNKASNLFSEKLLAGSLYFLEYIIIIPFILFFILGIFTLFLIVLSSNENTTQILLISSTIIAAIRMTAYYKEGLSQEIAKLLPLMLLATFILNPKLFSETSYFQKIITQIGQIPELINQIGIYFLFIVIIEIILRLFDFMFVLIGIEEIPIKEKEVKD